MANYMCVNRTNYFKVTDARRSKRSCRRLKRMQMKSFLSGKRKSMESLIMRLASMQVLSESRTKQKKQTMTVLLTGCRNM